MLGTLVCSITNGWTEIGSQELSADLVVNAVWFTPGGLDTLVSVGFVAWKDATVLLHLGDPNCRRNHLFDLGVGQSTGVMVIAITTYLGEPSFSS
jgi:hypothetical protein